MFVVVEFFFIFYVSILFIWRRLCLISIKQLKSYQFVRLTHNWWHVALCYLEGSAPMQSVLEVYNNYIWKELDKTDAAVPEVHNFIHFVTINTSFSFSGLCCEFWPNLKIGLLKCCGSTSAVVRTWWVGVFWWLSQDARRSPSRSSKLWYTVHDM